MTTWSAAVALSSASGVVGHIVKLWALHVCAVLWSAEIVRNWDSGSASIGGLIMPNKRILKASAELRSRNLLVILEVKFASANEGIFRKHQSTVSQGFCHSGSAELSSFWYQVSCALL